MLETLDNIKLDKENLEFYKAVEFVQKTDKLIYLTGKAGTGKTTFLKYIKDTTNKNTIIIAPTGVAAINAGGITINSFFQIPFGPFVPEDSRLRTIAKGTVNKETIFTTFKYSQEKREIIENLEMLIIDEISMVRADMLDVIDRILKVFRNKPNIPFGGVQLILIGDTFQLPPIVNNEQWTILSEFYKTPFFFSSKIIEQNTPLYIELKKIYRQNEKEFIDLLNRVRVSQLNSGDYNLLNSKYNPTFSDSKSDYIILATHNSIVNETNLTKLNQLTTKLFIYEANLTGVFPDKNKPTDHFLKLKVGAQIMFIKNDTGKHKRYHNGKIGKVKELEKSFIVVVFDDESEVEVERAVWNNIKYSYNREKKKIEEEIIGSFEQYPIRLAWAITVHKSQGLTFEKVIADLGRAFAPGQVYVALSRCTSLNGLTLKTQLNSYAIKTDPRVIEFAENETPETLVTEQLNIGKADFNYKKARENFENGKIKNAFYYFKKALKFRNDIDTPIFNKYIELQGELFFHNKKRNTLLIKELRLTKKELYDKSKNVEFLAQELKEQQELSKHFKTENKILEVKHSDVYNKLIKQITSTRAFRNEGIKFKKEIENQKQLYSNLITYKQNIERDKELLFKETLRLKDIKWYQKLFGKK